MNQTVDLVHRSATQRKACSGCVKAKRRCDLTIPNCSRCTSRNLLCKYNNSSAAIAVDSFPTKENAVLAPPADSPKSPPRVAAARGLHNGRSTFLPIDTTEQEMFSRLGSICGLYTQRTPCTADLFSRILDIKLKALIHASKSIVKVEHRLLAVQSLLLYQIILVFDKDFRQQADVERGLDLLDTWTTRLQEDYFDADISSFGSHQRQWIILESIRCTLMVSVFLRCIYRATQQGVTDLLPLLAILPVSRNPLRWESLSTDVQLGAYQDEESLVTYAGYVQDWNEGHVATVGEYENLLIRGCRHATQDRVRIA